MSKSITEYSSELSGVLLKVDVKEIENLILKIRRHPSALIIISDVFCSLLGKEFDTKIFINALKKILPDKIEDIFIRSINYLEIKDDVKSFKNFIKAIKLLITDQDEQLNFLRKLINSEDNFLEKIPPNLLGSFSSSKNAELQQLIVILASSRSEFRVLIKKSLIKNINNSDLLDVAFSIFEGREILAEFFVETSIVNKKVQLSNNPNFANLVQNIFGKKDFEYLSVFCAQILFFAAQQKNIKIDDLLKNLLDEIFRSLPDVNKKTKYQNILDSYSSLEVEEIKGDKVVKLLKQRISNLSPQLENKSHPKKGSIEALAIELGEMVRNPEKKHDVFNKVRQIYLLDNDEKFKADSKKVFGDLLKELFDDESENGKICFKNLIESFKKFSIKNPSFGNLFLLSNFLTTTAEYSPEILDRLIKSLDDNNGSIIRIASCSLIGMVEKIDFTQNQEGLINSSKKLISKIKENYTEENYYSFLNISLRGVSNNFFHNKKLNNQNKFDYLAQLVVSENDPIIFVKAFTESAFLNKEDLKSFSYFYFNSKVFDKNVALRAVVNFVLMMKVHQKDELEYFVEILSKMISEENDKVEFLTNICISFNEEKVEKNNEKMSLLIGILTEKVGSNKDGLIILLLTYCVDGGLDQDVILYLTDMLVEKLSDESDKFNCVVRICQSGFFDCLNIIEGGKSSENYLIITHLLSKKLNIPIKKINFFLGLINTTQKKPNICQIAMFQFVESIMEFEMSSDEKVKIISILANQINDNISLIKFLGSALKHYLKDESTNEFAASLLSKVCAEALSNSGKKADVPLIIAFNLATEGFKRTEIEKIVKKIDKNADSKKVDEIIISLDKCLQLMPKEISRLASEIEALLKTPSGKNVGQSRGSERLAPEKYSKEPMALG
ncbi:MAG: hypothetical protein ACJAW3_000267 [Lentimonas sp.]|jgi:hypothetical protein